MKKKVLPSLKGNELSSNSKLSQYRIERLVGHGSYAKVFEVIQISTDKQFAMKVMPVANLKSDGSRRRFQHEVDTIAIINHENVVKLHDFFSDKYNFYLIIDYCKDGDLSDALYERGRFSEATSAYIFKQILAAVAHCHSYGVAHRDLKLENILVDDFPHIKVGDFGFCGFVEPDTLMKTFCGSPCYCAPECLSKREYDGCLADVWSLGVILFSMLVGESPWCTTSTATMAKQIRSGTFTLPDFLSNDCKDLISMMLRPNPTERPGLNDLMTHPWFELANDLPSLPQIQLFPQLPQPKSINQLSDHSDESGSTHGIFSPFTDDEDDAPIELASIGSSTGNMISRSNGVFRLPSGPHSAFSGCQATRSPTTLNLRARYRPPSISKMTRNRIMPSIYE